MRATGVGLVGAGVVGAGLGFAIPRCAPTPVATTTSRGVWTADGGRGTPTKVQCRWATGRLISGRDSKLGRDEISGSVVVFAPGARLQRQ